MNNKLKSIIKSDIYRHYGGSLPPILLEWRNVALYCTIIYRKAHYYSNNKGGINKIKSLYYRWKLNVVARKYLFQIPYMVKIGRGFNLIHYGRIIIAPNAEIGDNCDILTGVTIGQTFRGTKKGSPKIGNQVYIGPNAVIVGNVTIGNNVLIAGNSFVNVDVPDNSIVIGNPAKIYPNEKATTGYINNKI